MSHFEVGDAVSYQPDYRVTPEHGVITKISDDRMTIHVRYGSDLHSKATRPADLTRSTPRPLKGAENGR